jgi:alcohol dehydrogenase (cytochrome c)
MPQRREEEMSGRLKLLAGAGLAFGILISVTQVGFAEDALTSADSNGWALYGRTYDNTRFSPLGQINTENVGQIKLAFAFELGSLRARAASTSRR